MENNITFTVPGNPTALKRHRTFQRGDFKGTYDPSKGDKGDFLAKAMSFKPDVPLDEPLRVKLSFYFQRPKAHYGTGKNANTLKGNAPTWHIKIPDADNLTKFVFDSFNKIFWRDDSIICQLVVIKMYSENPRVLIQISKIETNA